MNKSVSIITDLDGSKIALINDIRFKSRKGIDWNEVEQYLKEYIGEYFEISETSKYISVLIFQMSSVIQMIQRD